MAWGNQKDVATNKRFEESLRPYAFSIGTNTSWLLGHEQRQEFKTNGWYCSWVTIESSSKLNLKRKVL
ncbi:hypothetical protein MANES_02G044051v8 [Manihot esculenta]|uniref:Defective in cullin neddylation protein n=1 Tax=Manihot esculenta TaxID=3983 RepID=A0A2C9WB94_MANES|nr:hypothetical protein MANES_02G044051v8 [Manihot esculenta]